MRLDSFYFCLSFRRVRVESGSLIAVPSNEHEHTHNSSGHRGVLMVGWTLQPSLWVIGLGRGVGGLVGITS